MTKDDQTWLNVCYIVFALLIAYVTHSAISSLGLQLGWVERFDAWFSTATNVAAILMGASVAYWFQMDVERREYHLSSIGELRKVKWPSIPDTKKMTWIVCIVVAISSVILAIFDILWTKVLQVLLP